MTSPNLQNPVIDENAQNVAMNPKEQILNSSSTKRPSKKTSLERKEKQRIAAWRSRQKKKHEKATFEKEIANLEANKNHLILTIRQLREDVGNYESEILNHVMAGCVIEGYNA